jgi:hypothetical protein
VTKHGLQAWRHEHRVSRLRYFEVLPLKLEPRSQDVIVLNLEDMRRWTVGETSKIKLTLVMMCLCFRAVRGIYKAVPFNDHLRDICPVP